MDKVEEVLTKAVEEIIPNKNSLEKLLKSKRIRVYLGIDPTGTKLHVGHTIPLRKLQEFADLGHEAILVFGTGTVLAGDPSQRKEARKKISEGEIDENIKSWRNQASKVIDLNKVEIKKNGDWLLKLTISDILDIGSNVSAIQLFKRDMFNERLKRGDSVTFQETMYPLLQGYDSVAMDVDLEIGGTDQVFNMLIGRELQKKMKNREKFVLTTPLINGTDGKPMSKSSGNCIWLDDTPDDMFGKIMSIADGQIEEYWTNLTNLDLENLRKSNPMDAKKKLAHEIAKIYHGESSAQKAQTNFESTFQKGVGPKDAQKIKIGNAKSDLIDFLTEYNLVDSRSKAKRLLDDGAVEIDGQVVKDQKVDFKDGQVVKIGKKKFVKVEI